MKKTMNIKKEILSTILLTLAILCVFWLYPSEARASNYGNHTHKYTKTLNPDYQSIPATCEKAGKVVKGCNYPGCNKTKVVKTLPKLGHKFTKKCGNEKDFTVKWDEKDYYNAQRYKIFEQYKKHICSIKYKEKNATHHTVDMKIYKHCARCNKVSTKSSDAYSVSKVSMFHIANEPINGISNKTVKIGKKTVNLCFFDTDVKKMTCKYCGHKYSKDRVKLENMTSRVAFDTSLWALSFLFPKEAILTSSDYAYWNDVVKDLQVTTVNINGKSVITGMLIVFKGTGKLGPVKVFRTKKTTDIFVNSVTLADTLQQLREVRRQIDKIKKSKK